jgi:hypothetical protein
MPQAPDLELADRIIELMNDALARDPIAVTELIANRVPCNDDLATHPTIQVNPADDTVGMLGFLNGLCGIWGEEGTDGKGHLKNMGPITVGELVRTDPDQPASPPVLGRFMRTDILRKAPDAAP